MAAQANLLVRATLITSYEALVGLGLAALSGIGLAIVVVQSSYLRTIVMPSLVAVNAMPKVAVAPILIIWLGLGLWSKIAMAFLLSFFPIVINTVRGLSDVEPALIEYFRLLKASEFQTFFKARFPNALPAVFDGLKIALPIAVIGAVIGEFVASRQGIGYQIIRAYSSFDTEMVFAAVIAISVVSTLLFQALVSLERRVISWRPPEMR